MNGSDYPKTSESDTQTDNPAFEAQLALRTAERDAAFFLPHLRSGMDLLDVGCGPATITVGLAEAVAPGQVVGVDRDAAQIERARAFAAKRGAANVRFEVADVYELPFPDDSFDAAFAHVILMHLRDPVRALKELRRVLRPGGVIGVRDPDLATVIREPEIALPGELQRRLSAQGPAGPNPRFARTQRPVLLQAGFARAEAGASVTSFGSAEGCREQAGFLKARVPGLYRSAQAGVLEEIERTIDDWAERLDAFFSCTFCHAVGWVDG